MKRHEKGWLTIFIELLGKPFIVPTVRDNWDKRENHEGHCNSS